MNESTTKFSSEVNEFRIKLLSENVAIYRKLLKTFWKDPHSTTAINDEIHHSTEKIKELKLEIKN